jgi:hypothetical protein
MKVVVATNMLRLISEGKAFILNLQGAAPDRADETGAAI